MVDAFRELLPFFWHQLATSMAPRQAPCPTATSHQMAFGELYKDSITCQRVPNPPPLATVSSSS
jgi:hypothetical protein